MNSKGIVCLHHNRMKITLLLKNEMDQCKNFPPMLPRIYVFRFITRFAFMFYDG
jgi:hypothetical protein